MQLTGTIISVIPTQVGGYSSGNGWIYTYNITIQCQDGQHTGEIGAKSSPYPIANGEQISVVATTDQHGTKFKKFNPQYGQPEHSTALPASVSPPQYPQSPQNRPQTPKPQNGNKDRLIVAQVVFKALAEAGGVNEQLLSNNVDMIMRVGAGQKPKQIPLDQFVAENPVEQDDIAF